MTPFSATATIRATLKSSDRDSGRDMRMEAVSVEGKIPVFKPEDIGHVGVYYHCRQRISLAFKLPVGLFDMVGLQMRVTQRMHELAWLQAGHMGHHQS